MAVVQKGEKLEVLGFVLTNRGIWVFQRTQVTTWDTWDNETFIREQTACIYLPLSVS